MTDARPHTRLPSDRPPYDRLLVWTIIASHFPMPFLFSGVAVALPEMAVELGASARSTGLIETLFLGGSLALMLPAGRLADAADKGALFVGGMLSFALLSAAVAAADWLWLVLVLRFLQGATSALVAATGAALLADLVPAARRGRAFGAAMGTVYVGLTTGPAVAGWLVEELGWRAVFAFGAATIALVVGLVAWRLRPRWRRPDAGAVAAVDTAALVAIVLCVVLAVAQLDRGAAAAALLLGAGSLLSWFLHRQRTAGRPLLDLPAPARAPLLRAALLVQLLLYLNAFCSMFMLSLFLQVTLAMKAGDAGLVLAAGSLLMAVTAPIAGALGDRFRPLVVTTWGAAFVFASALLGSALAADSSPLHAGLVLALQSLGFGFFSSPNMAIIMSSAPREGSGMASALAALSRSIGMVTGMLVTAGLIALDFGSAPVKAHPERLVGTVTTVYSALAATAFVALVVTLRAARREPRP